MIDCLQSARRRLTIQVDVLGETLDWFMPANKALTVDKWLEVHGPARFYLKSGKSRSVKLTISCPKETDGELVGMVSFRYQTEHPSMVTPMISVSMYVIAAGHDKMAGEIKDCWRLQPADGGITLEFRSKIVAKRLPKAEWRTSST